MRLTKPSVFLTGFYVALFVWWVSIQVIQSKDSKFNLAFSFAYGLIPLIGCVFGIHASKRWGYFRSSLGKSLIFISLGLFTWGMGEMIWSYYNFVLLTEIPYPSWADASFIASWPLWSIGVIYLSFATGAKFGLRKMKGRLLMVLIPIVASIVSYYLIVTVARQGVFVIEGDSFKIFYDLAYPIWDVVIVTLALLVYGLSFHYLGGRFKLPVLTILAGFLVNYIADLGFSYTTTVGTYYNGNLTELMFMTAMFMLSFGVSLFDTRDI